jgi:hypothetical protein
MGELCQQLQRTIQVLPKSLWVSVTPVLVVLVGVAAAAAAAALLLWKG